MERIPNPRAVWLVQLGILASFWLFVLGLIIWISRLLRLSFELRDIPSASIGISLVAIPVFLLLLGLANYVFWGLRRGALKEKASVLSGEGGHGGH
jgi:hypothetical protein